MTDVEAQERTPANRLGCKAVYFNQGAADGLGVLPPHEAYDQTEEASYANGQAGEDDAGALDR
jgi:hypothetical protein